MNIKKYMDLVKFSHTIFSLPFILIAMIIGANGWFGFKLLVLGIIAAVSARNFAMAYNRFMDRDIDAKNPRTADRISVTGEMKTAEMVGFIILNAIIFIIDSYFINELAFKLSVPVLFVLAVYSHFKRFSELAHLVLGVALGLAPIAGAVAVSASIPAWSVFLALGVMFWVAGFDILYSLQDMEFDKNENLHSIPALVGEKGALFISKMFHIFAVIFWILFAFYAKLHIFGWIGILISAMLLFYEQRLVNKDFRNIPKAFFDVNGFLGIIFLIFIILDRI